MTDPTAAPATAPAVDSPARASASAWPDPWPAPAARGPVRGTVRLPGSKSLTNRCLVLAAVADGPSVLHGALDSRDSRLMRAALEALGARFADLPDGALAVMPLPVGEPLAAPVHVGCGLAGTVMRFLPAVAALRPGVTVVDGDAAARVRPMAPLIVGLRQSGVTVRELGEPGFLPLEITTPAPAQASAAPDAGAEADEAAPTGAARAEIAIDASASSQFLSGLLLSAVRRPGGLILRHTGETVPSPEHVAMTVTLLRERGVRVDTEEPGVWRVHPGRLAGFEARIEPDLSNAGPFLAAAAVTGGRVSVPDWPAQTTQIGDRWRQILPRFGAQVEFIPAADDPDGRAAAHGTLTVTGGTDAAGSPRVSGAGAVADTAELAPTVAALALLAAGPTRLTGIGHLRGHETDRLTALTAEAARLGVAVEQAADSLGFPGTDGSGPLTPAELRTYHDHRMATFAAVVGLRVPGVRVQDVATTAKTMPGFPAMWDALVDAQESIEDAPGRTDTHDARGRATTEEEA